MAIGRNARHFHPPIACVIARFQVQTIKKFNARAHPNAGQGGYVPFPCNLPIVVADGFGVVDEECAERFVRFSTVISDPFSDYDFVKAFWDLSVFGFVFQCRHDVMHAINPCNCPEGGALGFNEVLKGDFQTTPGVKLVMTNVER